MAETAPRMPLSQNEAAALGVAVLGHVALVAALMFFTPAELPVGGEGRMSVSISDESGLASSPSQSNVDLAQDYGPQLGDVPPPPEPDPVEVAKAEILPKPVPLVTRALAVQVPRPTTRPRDTGQTTSRSTKPSRQLGGQQGNCKTAFDRAYGTCGKNSDGTKLNLGSGPKGGGAPNTGKGQDPATGAQKVAWQNSVASQVQRPWQRCPVSGLDLDKLLIVIPFTLGRDGSVVSIGQPRVSGDNAANRNQVEPFKACAIKAIKQARTFAGLPPEYYDQWKSRELRFSKGRAQ